MFVRLFVLLFLLTMPRNSYAVPRLFDMSEFYLNNGLRVIVVNNPKAPIVKQMLWYKVGSMDEDLGKGGTAHLLEHLMFRGTKDVSGKEFNAVLEKSGAEVNAFTAQDVTAYHEFMDVSRLELALFLEADRMQNLMLNETDFALERDIVYQERMQVIENNPAAKFKESLQRALWQKHPYARPITGEPEEILGLSIVDIQKFYDRYYTASNAVLVISGDVTVDEVKPLVEKYFGKISDKKIDKSSDISLLTDKTKAFIQMSLPDISLPNISLNYATSSWGIDNADVYALMIFSKYLGEGDTSYLHKKLVENEKKAISISSNYNPYARSYGSFSVNAVPAYDMEINEFRKILKSEIVEALNSLNLEKLQHIKRRMLADLVYLKDNPEDAAYIVGMLASLGLKLEDINSYEDGLRNVKLRDVKVVVKKMLEKLPFAEGVLLPEEADGA